MHRNLLLANPASGEKLYVEDVFSTYLYNGTSAAQTITNGIDLSTKGGMVWVKSRSGATQNNAVYDTVRGATNEILVDTSFGNGQTTNANGITAFTTSGFSLGTSGGTVNTSSVTYASWSFRKASSFFDTFTYTGNAAGSRSFSHSLGVVPGMVVIKKYTNAGSGIFDDYWLVYHRSLAVNNYLFLNSTNSYSGATLNINSFSVTDATISINTNSSNFNRSGVNYLVYVFAHDTTANGLIQCGSYTGNGSASGPTVTLGWEPQFIMIKGAASGDWQIFDNMRGIPTGAADPYLFANTSAAEATTAGDLIDLTPTGFTIKSTNALVNTSSGTYVYMAIRRGPMRTPTDATKVFSPITSSSAAGTAQTTSFPIDLQMANYRAGDQANTTFSDRLRGVSTNSTDTFAFIRSTSTAAEGFSAASGGGSTRNWDNTGFSIAAYWGGASTMYWNFRRAPGFFDIVCYKRTTSGPVSHNLGVTPELIIYKVRDQADNWIVYAAPLGVTNALKLNTTAALITDGANYWTSSAPTASSIYAGIWLTAYNYVAYLFASCPGVSKVGSYTGTGTTKQIDCGFTNGARFVLIKRADAAGDWYVWDTARGIVAANDPHLSLNTTAAEVTTNDTIDPLSSGFTVNQVAATNVNVNAATYIYLAIA